MSVLVERDLVEGEPLATTAEPRQARQLEQTILVAVGAVMAARRYSASDAHDYLIGEAARRRLSVAELAREMVVQLTGHPVELGKG